MRAVICDRPMGASELRWTEIETPKPGPFEVLVKVSAFGLNRADIYQRNGEYAPPPGTLPVLGMELSGEVVQTGESVKSLKAGDQVMCLLSGAAYAEYAVVHEELAFSIPERINMNEAAALPEVMMVAQMVFFHLSQLQKGQRVLLHGGSSGVSSFAIQLCKQYGALVATTVRNNEKKRFVEELGADLAIVYSSDDFVDSIKSHPGFGGVDIILDFVGGPYLKRNLSVLNRFGSLILINSAGGDEGQMDLGNLIVGCHSIHGSVLRSRPLEHKIQFAKGVKQHILPLVRSGALKPCIGGIFSPSQVSEAHLQMESSDHMGKLVVNMNSFSG